MNSDSQLLQQVRVLDPVSNTDHTADVLLADGEIRAMEAHLATFPEDTQVLDAQGLILAPGLVDLYSYSGEPGNEARETLISLAAAAAAGGFTRLAILPNTLPPIDNPATVALLQQKIKNLSPLSPHTSHTSHTSHTPPTLPTLSLWGSLTLETEGKQMAELGELAAENIIGFTDGHPITNLALLRRLLEYLKPLGKPIALVPAINELKGNGAMREGILSMRYGLPGNPEMSETAAIAALLEIIAATGTPVHLMRISTGRGVELIANAKARGVPVTASTTWMHLLLDTKDLSSYDPNLRLEPPLGNETDRIALIEGVKRGIIDVIAIDHQAYTYEEKTVPFAEAPPGAIGLELALSLLWQQLVESGELSALDLWKALSLNPCLCLHQQPLECALGKPAELVLFDPQKTWKVDPSSLKSRCHNTPWLGKELTGKVIKIFSS